MFRRLPISLLLALLLFGACGDPTDSPEDCTVNEYFDDGSELCRTCPVLTPPTCPGDCGFFVREAEERPCPEAVCLVPSGQDCVCPPEADSCQPNCTDTQVWDARAFACIDCDVSCDAGFTLINGVCACEP